MIPLAEARGLVQAADGPVPHTNKFGPVEHVARLNGNQHLLDLVATSRAMRATVEESPGTKGLNRCRDL